MSEFFNFTNPRAQSKDRDLIETRFHQLAEAAMANISWAKQDTKMAEAFCTINSPLECVVLQFGASL